MSKAVKKGGIIGFFINNAVAANLLMLFVVVLGAISYAGLNKQIFPTPELNQLEIRVNYFGASPKEIEENVIKKIEDQLRNLPELKRMRSWTSRNSARVTLDIHKGVEVSFALDKVKANIDSISSFPADMDPILINVMESTQPVIRVALVGDGDIFAMKPYAQKLQSDLLNLNNVSLVNVTLPNREIAIEVDPMSLRMYQLTMEDIRQAIARFSENISSGQIRAEQGIITMRVEQQAYNTAAFANIPVITADNGMQIKLKQLATVKDAFVEGQHIYSYSGKPAAFVEVQATDEQDMSAVAQSVRDFVAYQNQQLPKWLKIETIIDGTSYLDQRLSMMEENLLQGAVLVLLMLSLFLSFKLAFWVVIGLPVCFLGATLLMPFFGVSINIISLFAFIMVLGLVVDDAIVVGESVHRQTEKDGHNNEAVEKGVRRVAKPAVFGVLTTIAVFLPFVFSDGDQSAMFQGISTIVIACLIFSIIESKLILPAHLAHSNVKPAKTSGFKYTLNQKLQSFTNNQLSRSVAWSIERKWSMLLLFVCALLVSLSMIHFGHVKNIPDPKVPFDFPEITIELQDNASEATVKRAVEQLDGMIKAIDDKVKQQYGQPVVADILIESVRQTEIKFTMPLVDESIRPIDTFALSKLWRDNMPEIVGLKSIRIVDDVLGRNSRFGDFGYFLYSEDIETLNSATKALIAQLKQVPGVYEVSSTISAGRREFVMALKPVANILGLEMSDIGRQLAQSHFGAEVERFNDNGEEVRVVVRYDQQIRASVSDLQYARIYTPNGDEVMLGDVVELQEKESVTAIRREMGKRSLYVYASVDRKQVPMWQVLGKVRKEILPQIKTSHPGISTQLGGQIVETRAEQDQMLLFSIAAMLMVYILLAVPLKSYVQPLLIMSIIPFSAIGAIWGHWLFGEDFSLVSMFGLVAAAGVVVNDSLILVDRFNQKAEQGIELVQGVIESVSERFRAIFLTSITTFVGLMPIMFEGSLQAKFVSPMAISLGFAVLFATFITLFLIPCLYIAGSRLKGKFANSRLFGKNNQTASA